MHFPSHFIQDVVARNDLIELIGRHVVLRKMGANYSGLCPFHTEKSPSFTVSPSKQFYHCFGCGKNGDALRFNMEHLGMGFVEAVTDLALQCGVPLPKDDSSAQQRAHAAAQAQIKQQQQTQLVAILEHAALAYQQHLKQSTEAIGYLQKRGLTGEIAKKFNIGYAPDGWCNLKSCFIDVPLNVDRDNVAASVKVPHMGASVGYKSDLLLQADLVVDKKDGRERYDRFRHRIMFPIRNLKGECIGFGGRVINPQDVPKYLNSSETAVFSKGNHLYGLFEAKTALREHGFALVVEGYMDVVALAQWGFGNAVATLGTACTTEHIQKIFKYTDSVIFSFDGDLAGQRAAVKALEIILPFVNDIRHAKFLFLPTEHDPDSYIREQGTAAFTQCIKQAIPLSQFLIATAKKGCDLSSMEGRSQLANQAAPLLKALSEGTLKQQILTNIANDVQLNTSELLAIWQGKVTSGSLVMAKQPWHKENKFNANWKITQTSHANPAWGKNATPFAQRHHHVARLLLQNPLTWEQLSPDDYAMLHAQPQPHCDVFMWIEALHHEYGTMPLGQIVQMLSESNLHFASMATNLALAVPLHASLEAVVNGNVVQKEIQQELRQLLNRMHVENIKQQETQALLDAQSGDSASVNRYILLQNRRKNIERLGSMVSINSRN